jgi:ABC-type glutathione transport system ATPase component
MGVVNNVSEKRLLILADEATAFLCPRYQVNLIKSIVGLMFFNLDL